MSEQADVDAVVAWFAEQQEKVVEVIEARGTIWDSTSKGCGTPLAPDEARPSSASMAN